MVCECVLTNFGEAAETIATAATDKVISNTILGAIACKTKKTIIAN